MTNNHLYMDKEISRRDTMVMIMCIMAIIVFIGVAVASWIQGEIPLALIDLTAALCLLILLVVFRFSSYKQASRYIGVAMMYCLYLYLLITGAAGGTSYMWHYIFPFFAIFL
ncbi:MAG: hypothetical protein GQ542_04075, partial [Desulforhopalus sp.]|nr:hypothetical protein [Desulforhopalus sp.]